MCDTYVIYYIYFLSQPELPEASICVTGLPSDFHLQRGFEASVGASVYLPELPFWQILPADVYS